MLEFILLLLLTMAICIAEIFLINYSFKLIDKLIYKKVDPFLVGGIQAVLIFGIFVFSVIMITKLLDSDFTRSYRTAAVEWLYH